MKKRALLAVTAACLTFGSVSTAFAANIPAAQDLPVYGTTITDECVKLLMTPDEVCVGDGTGGSDYFFTDVGYGNEIRYWFHNTSDFPVIVQLAEYVYEDGQVKCKRIPGTEFELKAGEQGYRSYMMDTDRRGMFEIRVVNNNVGRRDGAVKGYFSASQYPGTVGRTVPPSPPPEELDEEPPVTTTVQ